MTGFEPGSSGIGSDRSANCVTTTVILQPLLSYLQTDFYASCKNDERHFRDYFTAPSLHEDSFEVKKILPNIFLSPK